VSKTNASGPEGMPSPEPQRALSPVVSSNLQPRPPRAGWGRNAESPQGITPQFVLSAMRQWWKVALPVGLVLAGVAAALVYLTFEPVYEASAWLEIKDRAPYIVFPDRDSSRSFVKTQSALICSPLVLGPVVSKPEIAGLPEIAEQQAQIEWLAKKIKVAPEGDSEIFKISYASRSGQSAKKVVDAVIDEYFKLRGGTDAERTRRVIELLEAERDRRALDVNRLRENVRELTKQAGGKDPFVLNPTPEIGVQHPLAGLQARLTSAEVEGELLAAQVKTFEELTLGLGTKGRTSSDGSAALRLKGANNDIALKAAKPGPTLANVDIVLVAKEAAGDQAFVGFNPTAHTLTIDVDPAATTANAVIKALESEGRFHAELDRILDKGNDGKGMVCSVDVPDTVADRAVEGEAEFQARKAELAAKQARLEEAKSKLVDPEGSAIYKRLTAEIERDTKMLGDLGEKLRQGATGRLRAGLVNKWKDDLTGMRGQLESYQLMEDMLRKRCDDQKKNMQTASGETLELEFARADLDRAEKVFSLIAERVMQLRTEQRAPARVERLQAEAAVPQVPMEQYPWKKIVLAVLASLTLPFGLAVVWERLVRRVTDVEQLEEHSRLGVIGEVARLPVRTRMVRQSAAEWLARDLGVFEESIDSLRTCLVLSEPLRDMKVLAVTSGGSREGKTSVAVQLAVSLARASGQPTLLIDGDMRSPDVHNVLGVPLGPGLGDVLARKCSLSEAIVTDWSENLHFLPAGKARVSPHKLLGNGVVGALFDEVRASYRYVIVDTPPVLAAGEALVFASAADATLICTMRDRSRLDQVKRTQERLLAAGARPVGIVLNGVPVRRYLYRYGNYAYGHRQRQGTDGDAQATVAES
jgi:succinoglycan biosynthesis transport protein ExoP